MPHDHDTGWAATIALVAYGSLMVAGAAYFILFGSLGNHEGCEWTWAKHSPAPICIIAPND